MRQAREVRKFREIKIFFSDEISISLRYMLGSAYNNSFNDVRTHCVDMITLTLEKKKGFGEP